MTISTIWLGVKTSSVIVKICLNQLIFKINVVYLSHLAHVLIGSITQKLICVLVSPWRLFNLVSKCSRQLQIRSVTGLGLVSTVRNVSIIHVYRTHKYRFYHHCKWWERGIRAIWERWTRNNYYWERVNGECSQNSEREIICNENSERKIRKRQERCTGIPLTPPLLCLVTALDETLVYVQNEHRRSLLLECIVGVLVRNDPSIT